MDNIKDVVNKVIGGIAQKNPASNEKIQRIWENLLTKHELKHTKITGLDKNTLSINVDSPAWLYEMRTKQHKILKKIKEEVEEIRHIRFQIGSVK